MTTENGRHTVRLSGILRLVPEGDKLETYVGGQRLSDILSSPKLTGEAVSLEVTVYDIDDPDEPEAMDSAYAYA